RLVRAHHDAASAAAAARGTVEATRRELAGVNAALQGSPGQAEVTMQLKLIDEADQALDSARKTAAKQRADVAAAERERAALGGDEQQAGAALRRAGDRVVGLGAPEVDGTSLAAAWDALAAWAAAQLKQRGGQQPGLETAARELNRQLASGGDALTA